MIPEPTILPARLNEAQILEAQVGNLNGRKCCVQDSSEVIRELILVIFGGVMIIVGSIFYATCQQSKESCGPPAGIMGVGLGVFALGVGLLIGCRAKKSAWCQARCSCCTPNLV